MAEPLKHFAAGDPIPASASLYNAFVDAARAHRDKQNRLTGGSQVEVVPANVVFIRNDIGRALARGSIVGLRDVVITPTDNLAEFRGRPVFKAAWPAIPTHLDKWAVLAEPLRANAIGWAFIAGVVAVKVEFGYEGQPYAVIKRNTTGMLAGGEGGAKVLWAESGTGEKWAIVRLGQPHYPKLVGTLDGDLTQAIGYATMSVWGGLQPSDTGRNVTVYDWFLASGKKLASGAKVAAFWNSGKWYVDTSSVCPT